MQLNTFTKAAVLALSFTILVGAHPAEARKNDAEKFQDSINAFQDDLRDFAEDFDVILEERIGDDESFDDEDRVLAQRMQADAIRTFNALFAVLREEQYIAKYSKGISKKDRKNIRFELKQMYIELYVMRRDMNDALNEESSRTALGGVRSNITKAKRYLDANEDSWHDSVEVFFEGHAEALMGRYEESLENVDAIYLAYKDVLGEGNMEEFNVYRNRFSANYSDGVAFYEQAGNSTEARDIQLYLRSINKFNKAGDALKRAYQIIDELEGRLWL